MGEGCGLNCLASSGLKSRQKGRGRMDYETKQPPQAVCLTLWLLIEGFVFYHGLIVFFSMLSSIKRCIKRQIDCAFRFIIAYCGIKTCNYIERRDSNEVNNTQKRAYYKFHANYAAEKIELRFWTFPLRALKLKEKKTIISSFTRFLQVVAADKVNNSSCYSEVCL